jgi:hypothetical protein
VHAGVKDLKAKFAATFIPFCLETNLKGNLPLIGTTSLALLKVLL